MSLSDEMNIFNPTGLFSQKFDQVKGLVDKLLLLDTNHILVSNLNENRLDSGEYYCLVCDRNQIMFAEKKTGSKLNMKLDLNLNQLFFDGKPVELSDFDLFITHIRRVVLDVKSKQARVYKKKD